MKFNLTKGVVTLTSESQDEALSLFALATREIPAPSEVKKEVKKHKKHEFVKTCEVCGKGFKGLRSLNSHKSVMHGVRSKNFEAYRAWRMKRKAEKQTEFKPEFDAIWK